MKRKIQNITVAQAIVECLKQEQIRYVFGVPGESYLPLLDAIYDEPTIEFISTRHEGGASFMAEGYAKASRKCGVVLATRAVGGANLAIGVHTARQDSTPMVVFLGQVNSRFLGREGFQEVDMEAFFRPIAKWVVEIREAERVPELVQRAFRTAKTGRPGPVVVSLPEDVFSKTITEAVIAETYVPKPAPRQEDIRNIEERLERAQRPLVIAGGGVKWSGAEQLLRLWAEKYALPVMAAFRRHDVFPHNHPCYVGHLGLGAPKAVIETAEQADVVIALGTRLSEVTTQDYRLLSPNQTLIHIDIDSDGFGKVYAPDIAIWADCREVLSRLLDIAVRPSWQEWVAERRKRYEQTAVLPLEKRNLHEAVIASLGRHLPKNAVITNDAGNFAGWLHAFFPFGDGHTYIGPTSGAMGYGMPAAIGAKLAFPDRTVVSLSGDGGFMMTVQELETAARYDIPIISIVFNNHMYGTIRMHQELQFPGRVIGTDLGRVSFARLAECLNGRGFQVQTEQQFTEALFLALEAKKPTVIEVLTDPDHISVAATIQDLRAKRKS
ncbi:thiamine pyrophosphate-binding protein [Geobacillus proteiniphilus]|uniref:Thiamine pyrophosphate-binding protein n=1 Tax=Geobacillus proteiniphilus TaxID=860353 RepID=A0ABY9MDX7_9BACL|nr:MULTISPECIES: thiamine pyrophosphate-binding protein [Geobacillus]OPX01140.1 acetolactate synthase [Geobacillus sp. LEMMY01]WMJ15854.1 thiamine pyrophosphate-binding protein [Geobacillus proteiniphilus]